MVISNNLVLRTIGSEERETIASALDVLNRTHGVGLFGPHYLDERINSSLSYVLGAFLDQDLIGIAIAQVITDFSYYVPFQSDIAADLSGRIVGSLACSSVIEPLQGKGLGKILALKRLDWLRERQCELVLGVSWESCLCLQHTSKPIFERCGFRMVKRVEGFYIKSALEHPFDCPGCRVQPCACAALLYRRDFW